MKYELTTVYDHVAFTIFDNLDCSLKMKCDIDNASRNLAIKIIRDNEEYTNGTDDENGIYQGLCYLCQILYILRNINSGFSKLHDMFNFLDPDLTNEIDTQKANDFIVDFLGKNPIKL